MDNGNIFKSIVAGCATAVTITAIFIDGDGMKVTLLFAFLTGLVLGRWNGVKGQVAEQA